MAEISLRDYFAKLDHLLNATAADEVIHHCRHILQYYPKNVTTYRYLGRALLINGRWDEAMAALRRVLSVIPDDYHAHLGLSEIHDHRQQPDEAIWHLERAFEHNPNSRDLLEGLRALYRRYRNVDQAKIQLTAAAVARQAERNHAYEQAIETLRDALVRQPERIDLRALLVHALWESGDHVEAAETALDVLESLPDCLEANRILTALWLEEERPSDAQRYLSRIEAIDPYLAVEIAQGQVADDDAFRLEELDYKRTSQTEMVEERPAWLENISSDAMPEAAESSDADWSHFMSSMLAGSLNNEASPEPAGEVAQTADDLFGEEWMEAQASAPASIEDEIPDEFAALQPPVEQADEIPQFFDDSGSSSPFEPDPMTWLRETGMEPNEEPAQNGVQPDDAGAAKREADSLAWMQDDEYADQTRTRPQPGADAFSWMQEFDVELVQDQAEPEAPAAEEPVQAEETPAWLDDQSSLEEALGIEQLTGTGQDEALDWLNQSGEWSEDQAAAPVPEPQQASEPDAIELEMPDLFADMESSESQQAESIPTTEPQGVPGPRRGLTAMLSEANFDWMKKEESQEDVMSEEVMDEWLAHFGASPSKASTTTQEPEWLNELDTVMNENDNKQNNSDETPDWLSGTGENEVPQTPEEEEALAWLNQTASEAEPAEMPDWMAAMEPSDANVAPQELEEGEEEQPAFAEDFDWSATQVVPVEETAEPTQAPDWLTELTPTSTYEVGSGFLSEQLEQAEASDSQFEWLSEQAASPEGAQSSDDDYAWLDEAEIEAEAEEAALEDQLPAQEESPEWLSELAAGEPLPGQVEVPAAELPDEAWYDELEIEAEAAQDQEEEQVPLATPDWLSDLQINKPAETQATQAAPATANSTSFDWLDEVEDEAPVDAAEQLGEPANAELPDWLSELEISQATEPEAEAEGEDTPSWISQDVSQLEAATPVEENQDYGWMNELPQEEAATTVVPLPADTGDYAWLSELQSDEEQIESEAAEQEIEQEAEPVAAESGEFDWLNEINPEPEAAVEPVAAEVSDMGWLDELADENEVELEAVTAQTGDEFVATEVDDNAWAAASEDEEAVAAEMTEPEWLSEVAAESEEQPLVAEIGEPEWLSEVAPEPVDQPEPELAAIGEPEWLSELDSEQEEEDLSAEADAVSEAELEEEALDAEAVPSYLMQDDTADDEDEYWLNDEQETVAEPVGETSWDDALTESEDETILATNGFDLEAEGYEPAPASNAPDWLNAMVPGLDMNYETLEEEPAETEAVSDVPGEESEEAREYDWVEEIVEEESRQPAQRRFIFSRAPKWLRRSSEPAKRDDELPDWPSDEPEWQR